MNTAVAEKTTSATFRMPNNVYIAMQKQARENKTSVNMIVNQALYAYFIDKRPIMRPMLVAVPTLTFAEMLARLPEKDVRELGELTAERVSKSAILARHCEITLETILDLLRDSAQRAGYGIYNEFLDDKRIVSVRHELGYNGSTYLASTWETLFQMAGLRPAIEKTEDAVIIQL